MGGIIYHLNRENVLETIFFSWLGYICFYGVGYVFSEVSYVSPILMSFHPFLTS